MGLLRRILLLLVAALLVGCAAAGASGSSRTHRTPAAQADLSSLISPADMLKSLASGAGSYGAKSAYGWLLSGQLGDAQLAAIHKELAAINQRLDRIEEQLKKIELLIRQGHCNERSGRLEDARAATDKIWPRYAALSQAGSTQADRKRVADEIKTLDPGHYIHLIHNTLAKPSPSAPTLISACGELIQAKEGRFLTNKGSVEMHELVTFWQFYEAKLVTLAVELDHNEGANQAAVTTIGTGRTHLEAENRTLKRPIPPHTFLDTHTFGGCDCEVLWDQKPVFFQARPPFSLPEHHGMRFHLPAARLVFHLFKGCCENMSAEQWLRDKAGVDWSQAGGNWTPLQRYPRGCNVHGTASGTFLHHEPVLWTRSALEAAPLGLCKPSDHYGVGVSIRNRDRAGHLALWCGKYLQDCAYPRALPGIAIGHVSVKASDFVYGK